MARRMSKDEFIAKAKQVHGNKYDYSKVEYVNTMTKICIICPKHGEFWQRPNDHVQGKGCSKCKGEMISERNLFTTEQFIEKARKIHENKYDYSKVEYVNNRTKVCIICPIHGEFWQVPNSHLNGNGCKKCGRILAWDKIGRTSMESFLKKARAIYNNKYDYSKVKYVNSHTKVCIICPEHGEFWQTPIQHLKFQCRKCGIKNGHEKIKISTEKFIQKAIKIHGDKYDYSKVEYKDARTKVCIICPIHGEFFQTPNVHLTNHGCPFCNSSRLENEIKVFLDKNKIDYEFQKRFDWLGKKSLDFYLPKYDIAIECQGIQHFVEKGWNKSDNLKTIIDRDLKKLSLCLKNGINILYFTNIKLDNYPYKVFKDKKILLEYIKHEKEKN